MHTRRAAPARATTNTVFGAVDSRRLFGQFFRPGDTFIPCKSGYTPNCKRHYYVLFLLPFSCFFMKKHASLWHFTSISPSAAELAGMEKHVHVMRHRPIT